MGLKPSHFNSQVAMSMLDSQNHSEAVEHLEVATGEDRAGFRSAV